MFIYLFLFLVFFQLP
ncbi:cell surface protein, partial [Oenococcus oeni]